MMSTNPEMVPLDIIKEAQRKYRMKCTEKNAAVTALRLLTGKLPDYIKCRDKLGRCVYRSLRNDIVALTKECVANSKELTSVMERAFDVQVTKQDDALIGIRTVGSEVHYVNVMSGDGINSIRSDRNDNEAALLLSVGGGTFIKKLNECGCHVGRVAGMWALTKDGKVFTVLDYTGSEVKLIRSEGSVLLSKALEAQGINYAQDVETLCEEVALQISAAMDKEVTDRGYKARPSKDTSLDELIAAYKELLTPVQSNDWSSKLPAGVSDEYRSEKWVWCMSSELVEEKEYLTELLEEKVNDYGYSVYESWQPQPVVVSMGSQFRLVLPDKLADVLLSKKPEEGKRVIDWEFKEDNDELARYAEWQDEFKEYVVTRDGEYIVQVLAYDTGLWTMSDGRLTVDITEWVARHGEEVENGKLERYMYEALDKTVARVAASMGKVPKKND